MAINVNLGLIGITIGDPATLIDISTPSGIDYNRTGTNGNDVFLTILSSESIDGAEGNDSITDLLLGGGNLFFGNTGNDTLNGGAGNDILIGGADDDTVNGGVGEDVIVYDFVGVDDLNGGSNSDTLFLSGTTSASGITFAYANSGSFANGTTWTGFEQFAFAGSDFADSVTGSALDDAIDGGEGNDALLGGAGDDVLLGQGDDDTLTGGSGDDFVQGGEGNDTIIVAGDGHDEVAGEAGTDELRVQWTNATSGATVTLIDGTSGTITQGADRSVAFSGIDLLSVGATPFDDVLHGGDGDNVFHGLASNDQLFGDAGDDRLYGDAGQDTLTGGIGNDWYFLFPGDEVDTIVEAAGEGYDRVTTYFDITLGDAIERADLKGGARVVTGNALRNTLVGNRFGDTLTGLAGDDLLLGEDGADTLEGGSGNDRLEGAAGIDTLSGGLNNDRLEGGLADDVLSGGDGNDILIGGAETDVMTGGAGLDYFLFLEGDFGGDTVNAADRLTDFSALDGDRIDLSRVDAVAGGTDDAFAFIGTAAFSNVAGQLRVQVLGDGNTYLYGDTNGDSVRDFVIRLDGAATVNAGTFLL